MFEFYDLTHQVNLEVEFCAMTYKVVFRLRLTRFSLSLGSML